MTHTRTTHAMCCTRCLGRGWSFIVAEGRLEDCDHAKPMDELALDDDLERALRAESRVAEMERRLSEMAALCEREVREARVYALDQAIAAGEKMARDVMKQLARERGEGHRELEVGFAGHIIGAEEVVAAIRALKATP